MSSSQQWTCEDPAYQDCCFNQVENQGGNGIQADQVRFKLGDGLQQSLIKQSFVAAQPALIGIAIHDSNLMSRLFQRTRQVGQA